jgi:hypothetical protein
VSIGGVSLGATIGASEARMRGRVYNLRRPSDINGAYSAAEAGVAIVGGGKAARLRNGNGVLLVVSGAQVGLELALDLSGMTINLQ